MKRKERKSRDPRFDLRRSAEWCRGRDKEVGKCRFGRGTGSRVQAGWGDRRDPEAYIRFEG